MKTTLEPAPFILCETLGQYSYQDDVLYAEVIAAVDLMAANTDAETEGGFDFCERIGRLPVGDSFMDGGGAAPLVRYTGMSEGPR